MASVEFIEFRRQILDWRDKHIENIYQHLNCEIFYLYKKVNLEINKIPVFDLLTKNFPNKKTISLCERWIENEESILIEAARKDLEKIGPFQSNYRVEDKLFEKISIKEAIIIDLSNNKISCGTCLFPNSVMKEKFHIYLRNLLIGNKKKNSFCERLEVNIASFAKQVINEINR